MLSSEQHGSHTHEFTAAEGTCTNWALDMDGGGSHEATPSHPSPCRHGQLIINNEQPQRRQQRIKWSQRHNGDPRELKMSETQNICEEGLQTVSKASLREMV